jgi:hypothetical protein
MARDDLGTRAAISRTPQELTDAGGAFFTAGTIGDGTQAFAREHRVVELEELDVALKPPVERSVIVSRQSAVQRGRSHESPATVSDPIGQGDHSGGNLPRVSETSQGIIGTAYCVQKDLGGDV